MECKDKIARRKKKRDEKERGRARKTGEMKELRGRGKREAG